MPSKSDIIKRQQKKIRQLRDGSDYDSIFRDGMLAFHEELIRRVKNITEAKAGTAPGTIDIGEIMDDIKAEVIEGDWPKKVE